MDSFDALTPSTDGPFAAASNLTSSEMIRIPLIEEQLTVTTQLTETGRVTLTKTVQETQETVTVPLQQEHYTVERTTLNQYVDEPPATRQEGNTTIYSVVKEVVVVQKRLLLVEEVRVTKQQTQVEETQTVHLLKETIAVTRTPINSERPVQETDPR